MARLKFKKQKVNEITNTNEEFFEDDNPNSIPSKDMEDHSNIDSSENVDHQEDEKDNVNETVKNEHIEEDKKIDNQEENENSHQIEENNDDFIEGVYGESPMPEEREICDSLADISASEKSKIALEKENMEMFLNKRMDYIIEEFKYLSNKEKEIIIKDIMDADNNLGDILNNIYKNGFEKHIEDDHKKEDIEFYKKQIEELKQKLTEYDAFTKHIDALEEKNKEKDNEIKDNEIKDNKQDIGYENNQEKKNDDNVLKEKEHEKNDNNGVKFSEDNVDNSYIDVSNKLDKIKSVDRSPQYPEREEITHNKQPSSPSTSFVKKSRTPFGGDLTNIKKSIAIRNYKRVVNDINQCIDLTKRYNEDIYRFNNEAERLGLISISNDETLNDNQKRIKIKEMYDKNPAFMSLAKRIASNGRRIPSLHEKISDGLNETDKHGYDTSEAKRTYNDMVSTTNIEKPLISPPSLKLEEIAKKIVEAIKTALSKINNMFMRKTNEKSPDHFSPQ